MSKPRKFEEAWSIRQRAVTTIPKITFVGTSVAKTTLDMSLAAIKLKLIYVLRNAKNVAIHVFHMFRQL